MRTALITIAAVLIVCVLALTWMMQPQELPFDPSPPGQFPLAESRFAWPATTATKSYGPSKAMGTNHVAFAGGADLKAACATAPSCVAGF